MLIFFGEKNVQWIEAIRGVYYLRIREKTLKRHSQLMHMRTRYHFLAGLRDARETESEKRIRNTLNKPCRVKLVTTLSHIRALMFLNTYIPFRIPPMDFFQGKPNIDEYFWIQTSFLVRNCTKSESLSKVQGRESLIFQIHVTFSIDFPNVYNDYLLANVS